LRQIGLPFLWSPSNIDESDAFSGALSSPVLIAEKKARAVLPKHGDNWILGADTIVTLGRDVLGKPRDVQDARNMLTMLSGMEHRAITGFCLLDPAARTAHKEEITTLVKMKHLARDEIEAYIATGEPFGKAGSYAIQGIGAFMVESITGSYTNVVGLPICALVNALLACGALSIFPLPSITPIHDEEKG